MTEFMATFMLETPVRTGCAHCGESHYGSLEAGREWFQAHLAAEHPDVPVPAARPRRPSLHRIERRA